MYPLYVSSICILYMYPLYVSSICIFYMYPRCARVSLIVIVFFSLVRPWKQKIMINVPKIRDIYIFNIQNRHILIIYILKFKHLNQVRRWRLADLQTNLSYFVNILVSKLNMSLKFQISDRNCGSSFIIFIEFWSSLYRLILWEKEELRKSLPWEERIRKVKQQKRKKEKEKSEERQEKANKKEGEKNKVPKENQKSLKN